MKPAFEFLSIYLLIFKEILSISLYAYFIILQNLVESLFKFRDEYLLHNGIEKAVDKSKDVKEKAQEILKELDSLQSM